MKKMIYLIALAVIMCTLFACGTKSDNTEKDTNASGNFSSEMVIEGDSDVTIVEMP